MATAKQVDFFEQLLSDREFPPEVDTVSLRRDFGRLSDKSASAWIEKALALPEKGEVAPPF